MFDPRDRSEERTKPSSSSDLFSSSKSRLARVFFTNDSATDLATRHPTLVVVDSRADDVPVALPLLRVHPQHTSAPLLQRRLCLVIRTAGGIRTATATATAAVIDEFELLARVVGGARREALPTTDGAVWIFHPRYGRTVLRVHRGAPRVPVRRPHGPRDGLHVPCLQHHVPLSRQVPAVVHRHAPSGGERARYERRQRAPRRRQRRAVRQAPLQRRALVPVLVVPVRKHLVHHRAGLQQDVEHRLETVRGDQHVGVAQAPLQETRG
mmetsp:Transcript_5137/g.23675  ORF Transcript_5137/g.23675 Transcript_5137/m.23675 type:complete len:267 (+) Transcript_5137:1247-2047(+)